MERNIEVFCGQGEKRASGFFYRLYFCAVPRMLKNRRRKDDRKRTGEGRPLGRNRDAGFSTSAGTWEYINGCKS